MLIETPEVLAKAKRAKIRHQGRVYTMFVCVFNRIQMVWGRGICLEKRGRNALHCDTDPCHPALAPMGTPCHQAKDNQRVRSHDRSRVIERITATRGCRQETHKTRHGKNITSSSLNF